MCPLRFMSTTPLFVCVIGRGALARTSIEKELAHEDGVKLP